MSELDQNLAKLDGYLARFQGTGISNQIGGQAGPASGGKTFETRSPVDNSLICTVAKSDDEDIDRAAKAAKKAFPAWRDLAPTERKKILHAIADGIVERAEEIAFCECWDTGQALRFMSKAALRGAENFRFFADQAPAARDGKMLPSPTLMNVTTRVPIGPVGVITPWNTPFMLSTWKIAPALASGCTVVHKPAEASPLSARLLVEIAEAAGLPPGVLNVVNGYRRGRRKGADRASRHQGHRLCRRKPHRLDHHQTGRRYAQTHASRARRQEPGDRLRRCRSRSRARCGDLHDLLDQRRTLHLIITPSGAGHDPRGLRGHARRARQQDQGRPSARSDNRNRTIGLPGALRQGQKLCRHRQARTAPTIAAGGAPVEDEGFFVRPTLFTNANNNMRIAREEIFGPVLTSIAVCHRGGGARHRQRHRPTA